MGLNADKKLTENRTSTPAKTSEKKNKVNKRLQKYYFFLLKPL